MSNILNAQDHPGIIHLSQGNMAMENSTVSPSETEMRNMLEAITSFGNKAISALVSHSDLARRFDELNSRFTAIEQDVNWYKSENEKNIAQVNTLVAEKNQLAERNGKMAGEIDQLYSEVNRLEQERNAAQEAAKDNLARCNTLSYDLSEAQRDKSAAQDRERSLQETVQQLQNNVSGSEITINSLRDERDRFAKERDTARGNLLDANNRVVDAERKLESLKSSVADMQRFFAKVEDTPQTESVVERPKTAFGF